MIIYNFISIQSMKPSFHPRLINDPFSDPGLYIPFLFERRALLFDLGELGSLTAKELLKVSHVFVTHTHMDHFVGFDRLLRLFLGRDKDLHLFGPSGFLKNVEGKLAAYTWNLVNEYENSFILRITEVQEDSLITRSYSCQDSFKPVGSTRNDNFKGVLLKEPHFEVRCVLLDHRVQCMGLALKENYSVNIIKEGLQELDLEVGPWINRFKEALYEKLPVETDFMVTWEEKGKTTKEKKFKLGELTDSIATISEGQKITYITDVIGSEANKSRIISLAKNSDHLFIEAAFMNRDLDTARKKYHLTAKEAGEIAREAGVKNFTVFHFSPRYNHSEEEIRKEAMEAYYSR